MKMCYEAPCLRQAGSRLPEERVKAVLRSRLEEYTPALGETELVEAVLANPIGSRKNCWDGREPSP